MKIKRFPYKRFIRLKHLIKYELFNEPVTDLVVMSFPTGYTNYREALKDYNRLKRKFSPAERRIQLIKVAVILKDNHKEPLKNLVRGKKAVNALVVETIGAVH